MKNLKAIQNFKTLIDENNFIRLFYIADKKTGKPKSICFSTMKEATWHAAYLIRNGYISEKKCYIAQTTVYFG